MAAIKIMLCCVGCGVTRCILIIAAVRLLFQCVTKAGNQRQRRRLGSAGRVASLNSINMQRLVLPPPHSASASDPIPVIPCPLVEMSRTFVSCKLIALFVLKNILITRSATWRRAMRVTLHWEKLSSTCSQLPDFNLIESLLVEECFNVWCHFNYHFQLSVVISLSAHNYFDLVAGSSITTRQVSSGFLVHFPFCKTLIKANCVWSVCISPTIAITVACICFVLPELCSLSHSLFPPPSLKCGLANFLEFFSPLIRKHGNNAWD